MKTPNLVRDYSKLSEANLDLKAQSIILALTANANFAATVPTLVNFTAVKTAYTTALGKAVSRDRNLVAQKSAAKTALLLNMKLLAINIESLAQGDKVKLISSGFELTSEGESASTIETPTDFTVTDGMNPGEVKTSVRGMRNAVSFLHEISTDALITDESKWISKATTSRENTFTNIPSRTLIHARVAAIGRKGQDAFTGILTRVVQ